LYYESSTKTSTSTNLCFMAATLPLLATPLRSPHLSLPNTLLNFDLGWDGICHVDTDPEPSNDPAPTPTPPNPPEPEDVSGLKSALAKERAAREQQEKQLKALEAAFGDLDPAKLKEMRDTLEKQRQLEDTLNKQRIEAEKRHERELAERTSALSQERQRLASELAELQQRQRIQEEFIKLDGDKNAFEDFYRAIKHELQLDENGEYRIVRNGKTVYLDAEHKWADKDPSNSRRGQPFGLTDLMEESRMGHRKRFFNNTNRASGSGNTGGSVGGNNVDWRSLPPKERMAYARKMKQEGRG
jgi:hypothetical protein